MPKTIFSFLRAKWLFVASGAAIVVVILLLSQGTPKLTETSLVDGQPNVDLNSELVLVFDRATDVSKLKITSTPPDDYQIASQAPSRVVVTHTKSFYQNTAYTLEVYYGNKLLQTLSFHTQKSESNPRDLQLIQDEVERDYPLAESLPYTTDNYQVVYIAPLTLQVELYQDSLNQEEIKKALFSWIKTEGVDPESHQLIFTLPEHPTPTTYH